MPGPSSRTIRTFQTADAEPLAALLRDSLAAGEQSGNTASDFEGLIGAFPIARNFLVAEQDGEPVGLICSDYRLIVVRPDLRRQGIGRALVDAAEEQLASTLDGPLVLFPPHGSDTALAFLNAIGFAYDHSFWRFRLDPHHVGDFPSLPPDIIQTGYVADEIMSYVDLINEAFAAHPTPLRVTLEQIEHIHAKPTFDPTAIVLLRNEASELIGFCITGVNRDVGPPVGTINLVGVLDSYRGRGLGKWLLLWGINRLRSNGIDTIELSVDAENANAVSLYRSVGFDPVEEWPQWMRPKTA